MKYKRHCSLAMIVFLIFTAQSIKAQSIVKGNITDAASHLPLEGITVQLMPEKISGTTDQLGNFSLKQEKENNNIIQVSSIGYETKTLTLDDLKVSQFQCRAGSQKR